MKCIGGFDGCTQCTAVYDLNTEFNVYSLYSILCDIFYILSVEPTFTSHRTTYTEHKIKFGSNFRFIPLFYSLHTVEE